MAYNHEKEQASTYAKKAFDRLKKEALAPTPEIFELWYAYYAKARPEIIEAVNAVQTSGEKFTEDKCRELYNGFLSCRRSEEAYRKAGEQINATISGMNDVVRDVKDATTEYNGKLSGVTTSMSDLDDPVKLKGILETVISDTASMIETNHKLEQQLDQSSLVMEEMQRDLEIFRKEALTDGLTGLANRKAFDVEIERAVTAAKKEGLEFSLLMVDIDHFKSFNDNFGHQVGDQVLRLVAKTLIDGVKGRDLVARYGGEEFAIILPETKLTSAVTVGNALRKAMATKDVINRSNGEKLARITMSLGAAEHVKGEGISALIERADSALYTAKRNGRNQVAAAPMSAKMS